MQKPDTLLEFKRAIDTTSRCRNPVYPRGSSSEPPAAHRHTGRRRHRPRSRARDVKVMRAAAQKVRAGNRLASRCRSAGKRIDELGYTLPPGTLEKLDTLDGWVLGPIGHQAYPKGNPNSINPHPILRKHYDLFANIRPAKSLPGVAGALQRRGSGHRAREQRRHAARSQCLHGQRRVPSDARHDDRRPGDHAPGLEQGGASGVRARAHASRARK